MEELNKGTFKINLKPVAQRLIIIHSDHDDHNGSITLINMMTMRMFLIMMSTRFNSWRGKKSFEKSPDSDPKTASKKVSIYVVNIFCNLMKRLNLTQPLPGRNRRKRRRKTQPVLRRRSLNGRRRSRPIVSRRRRRC